MRLCRWVAGLSLGCNGPAPEDQPKDDADPPSETADTGSQPTTPPEDPLEITNAAASLDEDVGTVVWVGWDQSAAATVHLEFEVDAGVVHRSPERVLEAGAHQELLLGIPYDSDATWRIVAVDDVGTVTTPDAIVHTAAAPDDLPVATVHLSTAGYDESLPWLLVAIDTYSYGQWTEIVDREGRVVWAMQTPTDRWTGYPQVSVAGDRLLIDHNSAFAFEGPELATVDALTIDGAVTHTFATPGLHQSFTALPDGGIAYARFYDGYSEDLTAVAVDGTITQLFDCDRWLADFDPSWYCATNTVWRDPATGNFLITLYSIATIVEIDPTTGTALRWFGFAPDSWAAEPAGSQLVYPHGSHFTDAGTLLVSDFSNDLFDEVIVREYSLDPVTETLTDIWSFGLGEGIPGIGFGAAVRMPNGNTQQNCGVARVREITEPGEVVWDLEWLHPVYPFMAIGLSTPLADLYPLAPDRD